MNEHDSPHAPMHDLRRTILFHVSAMLDVKNCRLGFLNEPSLSEMQYRKQLYDAVIRIAVALDDSLAEKNHELRFISQIMHEEMVKCLEENGIREPYFALR